MLNKKRLLALTMSSAMIASALAGCSGSSSKAAETTAAKTTAAETTKAAETTTVAETTTEAANQASYKIEAGKVIDFEDGNCAFAMMNVQTPVADDSKLEVVDFNGSKALKVTPASKNAGMTSTLGLDVTSLLGAKVADVASVSMQIAVEAVDGKFYACTGSVRQNFTDASGTNFSIYSERKNPNEVTATFNASYDASAKNVLTISKDSSSGNNSDTAFAKTGAYSTMYIDNIVFFDKDGNPIDVNTTVAFDAPDGFGEADWSNLIKVTNQTVIDGFAASDVGGWAQKPDWLTNIHTELVDKQEVDADGNKVVDADGKPVYVVAKDDAGNDVVDEDGNPVYEKEEVKAGNYDWASIMKPGTVFTLYFTSEPSNDLNQYIWWVMAWGDMGMGWNRILDAPSAAGAGVLREDTPEAKKGHLFAVNDSFSMAQVTYEEIVQFIADNYADKLPEGVTAETLDWANGNYGFQAEAGMKWTLSAVTYALDQTY